MDSIVFFLFAIALISVLILVKLTFMKYTTELKVKSPKWLKESLHFLTNKINQMSEVLDRLNAKVDRLIAASTGVAGDIRSIKDQLVGGVSADEAEALSQRLEDAASRLEGIDAETPGIEAPPADGGETP